MAHLVACIGGATAGATAGAGATSGGARGTRGVVAGASSMEPPESMADGVPGGGWWFYNG